MLKFQLNNKTCIVNGSMVTMDVAPTSINGRTLIPVVYVANPLGAKVDWDGSTKKVTIVLKGTTLELWIGNATAKVNGADTPIDPANSEVKPIILSGRTMLPLRFVAEKLGCDVAWDEATKGITISEKTATTDAGGAEKPGETTKPNFGLAGPGVINPNPGIKDTLIGQMPGPPESKLSEGKPKDDTKEEEERLKNIRTGFKPGYEDKDNYVAVAFGIYYKRRTDAAEVFYTLDELAIERNTLREKRKSGGILTADEQANLAELEKIVPIGIQKLKQLNYENGLKLAKELLAEGADFKGKSAEEFAASFAKSFEPAIDVYYSRSMPPSPSAEGFSRYYLADFVIAGTEIGPYSFEELLNKLKHVHGDITDELLNTARGDRIKELRAKGVSEPEIKRKMRALEPPEDPGSKNGKRLYYFEPKAGEFGAYTCDQIMEFRREMRKTPEGRELLELQKDIINKIIEDKRNEIGDTRLTEYLDQFEDAPSWVRNNKKVSQTLSDANKDLDVIKHLGRGYDVIKSRYGESDGLRQPVLNTQALYQYHFLHQSLINEISEKSIITENLREYSKKLTTEIGISGNYLCFSGSVNTSFGSEEARKTSRYYATHSIIKPEFDFYVSMPGKSAELYRNYRYFLTETARKEIDDPSFPVRTLVDKYGQYVLVGLTSGAKQDYNLSIAKDKVFSKDDFSMKVKASVKAIFAGASVEVKHSSSVSQGSFDQSVEKTVRTVGFRFAINPDKLDEDVRNSIAFFDTGSKGNMVDYSRVLGKNSIIPLDRLAQNADRSTAIRKEIENRLKAAGNANLPEQKEPNLHNNYLVGIRVGLANEGWDDAVAKAKSADLQYGSPRHGEPVFWKIMSKNPFTEEGADLNDGVVKSGRDVIVLNLAWLPKNYSNVAPIRDLYIAQNNKKAGWTNDTHNGTSGKWYLLNKDLNYNAGGSYLYLGWTSAGEKKPIVDMVLCIGKPDELYPGWEVVKYKGSNTPANLNEGAKGSEIYLVIRREP